MVKVVQLHTVEVSRVTGKYRDSIPSTMSKMNLGETELPALLVSTQTY